MVNFHNVKLEKTAYIPKDYPGILPEFVFAGRSNVGKSSMINKLLGRKSLARVSSEPGKTRSVNFYNVDNRFYLTDLPGYGFAKVSYAERDKWKKIIDSYFASGRDIRLVIVVVDIRHEPSAEDKMMVDYLFSTDYDFMVVASKCDKLSKTRQQENCRMIAESLGIDAEVLPFSSVSGDNAERLKNMFCENSSGEE